MGFSIVVQIITNKYYDDFNFNEKNCFLLQNPFCALYLPRDPLQDSQKNAIFDHFISEIPGKGLYTVNSMLGAHLTHIESTNTLVDSIGRALMALNVAPHHDHNDNDDDDVILM